MLLSTDIPGACAFWRDRCGFEVDCFGEPPQFAICSRGGARLMYALAPAGAVIVPNWRVLPKCNSAYIWVGDAAALYAEFQAQGAAIDFTIYDTPWGTREFGIQDPDGHDIAFGQIL
ncbi:MAG: bleomycin resistance protein [Candidatus Sumerlaeia bacterium]|nr:bleomycin resistance protein [Candidatus Sumerlaeia bacterium]